MKGFVILPQQDGVSRKLVALEHLRKYILGERADPDKSVKNFRDYVMANMYSDDVQAVPFTLELSLAEVTAIFEGSVSGGFPLEFGTDALSFMFPSDQGKFVLSPSGTVYSNDWEFDVISPDGRHVLLIQSHYGPFHIVSIDRLHKYLVGDIRPDYEIDWEFPSSNGDAVLSDGGWWATHLVVFNATCCGTTKRLVYELGSLEGPVLYNDGD